MIVFGNRVFANIISYRSQNENILDTVWAINPMVHVFISRKRRVVHADTQESHVRTQAEMGMMWPRPRSHQELAGAERGKEGPSPRAMGGRRALLPP